MRVMRVLVKFISRSGSLQLRKSDISIESDCNFRQRHKTSTNQCGTLS